MKKNDKMHHYSLIKRIVAAVLVLCVVFGFTPVGIIKANEPSMRVVRDDSNEQKAKEVLQKIKSCLKKRMDFEHDDFKTAFNETEHEYVSAGSNVISIIGTVDLDTGEHGSYLNQMFSYLTGLIRSAYELSLLIDDIPYPVTNLNYEQFMSKIETVITKKNEFESSFEQFKTEEGLEKCLSGVDADVLLKLKEYKISFSDKEFKFDSATINKSYYEKFKEFESLYNIEKEYDSIYASCNETALQQSGLDDITSNLIQNFIDIVNDNGGDDALLKELNLYNGNSIYDFLKKFKHVRDFRAALANVSPSPKSEAEMKVAIYAYSQYENLTDAEKKLVSSGDKEELDKRCLKETGIQELVEMIDAIVFPTDDNSFVTFSEKYLSAYNKYQAIMLKFNSYSDIDRMIPNRDKLLYECKAVKDIIERIKDVLVALPVEKCLLFTTSMTKIYNDYSTLSLARKNSIYNWAAFDEVYKDTKAAYDLRTRIDRLRIALTPEDKNELESIRSEYSLLNDNAHSYFGQTYENYLKALEYDLYVKMKNNAELVIDLINKIGTVTAKSGKAIVRAETEYASLTPSERDLVTNYATLQAARAKFESLRTDITYASVSGIKNGGYVYTHATIKPKPVVKVDGVVLTKGVDYRLTYTKNKNVGTAYVEIVALETSAYKGNLKKKFKIIQDSIAGSDSGVKVSKVKSKYKYTGKNIKPTPTVKIKVLGITYRLKKGTDYTVSYKNNKKKGTATIKIKGKGNYKGSRTVKFKIV
ncbi:MAG: hypothetical protein K5639_05685 [Eubacterium sp.]|nr:hypothetical protein [Eubacterium sp.]